MLEYAVCAKCRAAIQYTCRICGTKTLEQFHDSICFRIDDFDEINYSKIPIYAEEKLKSKII